MARAGLDEYVSGPIPRSPGRSKRSRRRARGTATSLKLDLAGLAGDHLEAPARGSTSRPRSRIPDAVLLFITGGSTSEQGPATTTTRWASALAEALRGRVAVLQQVPNQPLLGDKKEDDADRRDVRPLPRDQGRELAAALPDGQERRQGDGRRAGLGQGGGQAGGRAVRGDRGLEAGLDHLADRRRRPAVIAIAPMVIVMLNMKAQKPNQLEVWGKYSEQIDDYVSRGLMERSRRPTARSSGRWSTPTPTATA